MQKMIKVTQVKYRTYEQIIPCKEDIDLTWSRADFLYNYSQLDRVGLLL